MESNRPISERLWVQILPRLPDRHTSGMNAIKACSLSRSEESAILRIDVIAA